MKTLRIVSLAFLFFGLLAPLSAMGVWDNGSGVQAVRHYPVEGFSSLDVSAGIQVNLVQGTTFAVSVKGDVSKLDRLEVVKEGTTLRIGYKPMTFGGFGNVQFDIVIPRLSGLVLSGGSHAVVKFQGQDDTSCSVEASGGSRIEGVLTAKELTLELSGGSACLVEGYSDSLIAGLSGGSRFDCKDFATGSASISASGGSRAVLGVDRQLMVDASGGSAVNYLGKPAVVRKVSGGSSVEALR